MTGDPIEDHHRVFRRVHNDRKNWNAQEDRPKNQAFTNSGHGDKPPAMSVDWSKRCEPEDTRERADDYPSAEFFVVSFVVGDVRRFDLQGVAYEPLKENDAHSAVTGPKTKTDFCAASPMVDPDENHLRSLALRREFIRWAHIELRPTG